MLQNSKKTKIVLMVKKSDCFDRVACNISVKYVTINV